MKTMKKIFAFMLSFAMMLSLTGIVNAGKASAAELTAGTKGGDKTITITSPSNAQASDEFTYTIYKVFDATSDGKGGISYKLLNDATAAPAGFTVDDAGNVYLGTVSTEESAGAIKIIVEGETKYLTPQTTELTAEQIAAISNYTSKQEVGTTTITGANQEKTVVVPDYGYYFITTTTGSIVTINSTNPAASVQDKNKVPTLDKDIANVAGVDGTGADNENSESATAKIGDTINYTVNITAYAGAENYVYHDILSKGLTLVTDTEPVVSVVGGAALTKGQDYTLTKFANNVTNGTDDNITITFNKSYLDTVTDNTVINITYSAILNEGAVIAGAGNPNTAKLDYGKTGFTNSTPEDEPVVYTYEFQLVKDNASKEILNGAEFELYASNKTTKLNLVQTEGGDYLIQSSTDETNTPVDKIVAGTPKIIGLANGTYYLKEINAPTGYNCLNEMIEVVIDNANNNATINDNTYVSGGVEVVNKSGSALPSTGGIGTTIFYVLGGILMAAAVVLLITKKKMSAYKD